MSISHSWRRVPNVYSRRAIRPHSGHQLSWYAGLEVSSRLPSPRLSYSTNGPGPILAVAAPAFPRSPHKKAGVSIFTGGPADTHAALGLARAAAVPNLRARMPQSALTPFDQTVLDLIDHSPTGSVPRTPTYDESLTRLLAAQQVFHSTDFKDAFVTARSLARRPLFVATGLLELAAHPEDHSQLESNASVFDRYVASLPEALRTRAETFRLSTAGRPVHHRPKVGGPLVRDPLHSIFLVPGVGPQPGLPGNYLRGALDELPAAEGRTHFRIQVLDADTDAAVCELPDLAEALGRLRDLTESAPFHLSELEALGFESR